MGAPRFVKAHTTPTPKPFSDLQADEWTPNTIPGWADRTTCHSKRSTRQSSIFQKKCSGFGVKHLKIHPGSGAADISGNKSPLSIAFSPSCKEQLSKLHHIPHTDVATCSSVTSLSPASPPRDLSPRDPPQCHRRPKPRRVVQHEALAGEGSSQPCLTEIILFESDTLFQQF